MVRDAGTPTDVTDPDVAVVDEPSASPVWILIRASGELGQFWHLSGHSSKIATARVQPAEPAAIFTGKQATLNPFAGSPSRLCNFSTWQ